MKINWRALSEKEDVDINIEFQQSEAPLFLRKQLTQKYQEIDEDFLKTLSWDKAQEYLRTKLSEIYKKYKNDIDAKVKECQDFFDDDKMREISDAFSSAFGIDCHKILNNISGRIGINPVCPRYIQDDTGFDMPFFCNVNWIVHFSLHEMVHFVWFRLWHEHFKDSWNEYENPHLKWLLSEMIVDPIIRNSQLRKFFPDIDNNRNISYYYFYDMEIGDAPILKTVSDFYKNNSTTGCMEKSYAYCVEHEKELREKIALAEGGKK